VACIGRWGAGVLGCWGAGVLGCWGPAGDVVLLCRSIRRSASSSAAIRVSRAVAVTVGSVGVGCGTPREK